MDRFRLEPPGPARSESTAWRVARVVAGIAIAVFVLTGIALAAVSTRWATNVVRKVLVSTVDGALQGKLAIGALELPRPFSHLVLRDVALDDPDGHPVARIERIEVRYSALGLLRKRVDVQSLTVTRPDLVIQKDEGGMNVSRALAPEQRREPPPGHQNDWDISVGRLAIERGHLLVRVGKAQPVEIEELALAGWMHLHARSGSFEGALDSTGRSMRSIEGPLTLEAAVNGTSPVDNGRLRLEIGKALSIRGSLKHGTGRIDADYHAEGAAVIAHARLDQQRLADLDVRANGPGLSVDVKGSEPAGEPLDVRATAQLRDLAAAARLVERISGSRVPAVAGVGQLRLEASRAPGRSIDGIEANLSAQFPSLRVGARTLDGLVVAATLGKEEKGRYPFKIAVKVARPGPLQLASSGNHSPWSAGLPFTADLFHFRLVYGTQGMALDGVGTLQLVVSETRVKLNGRVSTPVGVARLSCNLPSTWPLPVDAPLAMDIHVSDVLLDRAAALLGPKALPVRPKGVADFALKVSGTTADPRLDAYLLLGGMRLTARGTSPPPPLQVTRGAIDIRYVRRRLDLTADLSTTDGGRIAANVGMRVDLSPPTLLHHFPNLVREPIAGDIRLASIPTDWLSTMMPRLHGVRGKVNGHVDVRGTLVQPHLDARIDWKGGGLIVGPPPSSANSAGSAAPAGSPAEEAPAKAP